MTAKIKTKKRTLTEETIEVSLPAFFKKDDRYIGIFDLDNVVEFFKGLYYQSVTSYSVDFISDMEGYEPIDEQDFRIEHMKHMSKFNLPARNVTTEELSEIAY